MRVTDTVVDQNGQQFSPTLVKDTPHSQWYSVHMRLLPNREQMECLYETLVKFNLACNILRERAPHDILIRGDLIWLRMHLYQTIHKDFALPHFITASVFDWVVTHCRRHGVNTPLSPEGDLPYLARAVLWRQFYKASLPTLTGRQDVLFRVMKYTVSHERIGRTKVILSYDNGAFYLRAKILIPGECLALATQTLSE